MTLSKTVLACTLGLLSMTESETTLSDRKWLAEPDGIGPVKIGMTRSQLGSVLHTRIDGPSEDEAESCYYSEPNNHPNLHLMIQDRRLVRLDVNAPGIKTTAGIQVGDSERRAIDVYGRRLKIEPHAYINPGGHYMTLHSKDKRYGIRFETDEGKITSFYVGTSAAIQIIEGCE